MNLLLLLLLEFGRLEFGVWVLGRWGVWSSEFLIFGL